LAHGEIKFYALCNPRAKDQKGSHGKMIWMYVVQPFHGWEVNKKRRLRHSRLVTFGLTGFAFGFNDKAVMVPMETHLHANQLTACSKYHAMVLSKPSCSAVLGA